MNKAITYSGATLASFGLIALFLTAKTPLQLGIAIALYPVFILFLFKFFILKSNNQPQATSLFTLSPVRQEKKEETDHKHKGSVEIVDIDKRAFLKLVGGVGLSFFIFSIFNKKVGNLLLGGAGSDTQAPASPSQLTDGYKISEIASNEEHSFYGFITKDGKWLIMREDIATGSFRYAKGNPDFSLNWTHREGLDYSYYHDTFQN